MAGIGGHRFLIKKWKNYLKKQFLNVFLFKNNKDVFTFYSYGWTCRPAPFNIVAAIICWRRVNLVINDSHATDPLTGLFAVSLCVCVCVVQAPTCWLSLVSRDEPERR